VGNYTSGYGGVKTERAEKLAAAGHRGPGREVSVVSGNVAPGPNPWSEKMILGGSRFWPAV